jgi:hypothetical protein
VLELVSQQFVPPLETAGQLFWQSLSMAHDVTHALPPPDDVPLELPPDDVPFELLPEDELFEAFPEDELFEPPSSPLFGAVAS